MSSPITSWFPIGAMLEGALSPFRTILLLWFVTFLGYMTGTLGVLIFLSIAEGTAIDLSSLHSILKTLLLWFTLLPLILIYSTIFSIYSLFFKVALLMSYLVFALCDSLRGRRNTLLSIFSICLADNVFLFYISK